MDGDAYEYRRRSEHSQSHVATDAALTGRDASVADYELLLQDNMNMENL